MIERLGILPPASAILMLTYTKDGKGLILPPGRFVEDYAAAANAPLYTLYRHHVSAGAAGGVVVDGDRQGAATARLAPAVLAGAPPASLEPIDERASSAVVSGEAVRRWKPDVAAAGRPVEVLGGKSPPSFLDTHLALVWTTAGALAVLIGPGVFAPFVGRRRAGRRQARSGRQVARQFGVSQTVSADNRAKPSLFSITRGARRSNQ